MATGTSVNGNKLLLQIGDGASPETFSQPCAVNSKEIDFSAEMSEADDPDCDDPTLPMWKARIVKSLSLGMTCSGLLKTEALETWRGFFMGGVSKNCRAALDLPLASNGGYFAGTMVCSGFKITGEDGDFTTFEATLASDGPVTWTDAAA
ncbi:phage tail tube protein [Parvibaculum sp. MBR-TMA-1.3b-4.2]|jgi:predicted secreted protein